MVCGYAGKMDTGDFKLGAGIEIRSACRCKTHQALPERLDN